MADTPLRHGWVGTLLGRNPTAPQLPATASKFGGVPYAEDDEDWLGWRFLGQVDLAEAAKHLPHSPLAGLLRLDSSDLPGSAGFRVRWFPAPDLSKAITPTVSSVAKWETRHEFKGGWSLPHNDRDWFSLLPPKGELDAIHRETGLSLWDFWNDWEPAGFNDDAREEFHTILGWPSGGLDEPYGFDPPPDCSGDASDYEMLVRLTFDNAAGFSWGTNWIYLLVPKNDLARGDLSRVLVTGANA
ncbi:MAG: DUF1963 domain-containing protein [Deltaproteobacteria bacterium]|nr:DUF1963 domain-containing protein [Deltaproteobacteria bacterium]